MKFDLKPTVHVTGTGKDDVSAGVSARFDHNDLSVQVRASDAGLRGNGSLTDGLVVSARKDGHFTFQYDVGSDSPSLTFLSNARVANKDVALKYHHDVKGKGNRLQGRVDIDDKTSATVGWNLHGFDAPDYKQFDLKLNYRHDDKWSFEPSYDFGREAFAARVNHHLDDENSLSMHYDAHSNQGSLEWTNHSIGGPGALRVSATSSLSDSGLKQMPSITASKVFDLEL
ncbi:hypothetical protein HOP50_03g25150 [Chloropicon primus]|uniref:Uncharacterized protein n=1 Tax=Chloropicon primus TaxID=1764295 RepID=A0A5B8MHT2_9CHLO|nr:hypothetical protein A3770_03p25150 [Chloropicon primus]UPQ99208.1 hypothetical protein HOP50_03g25150 [Chloropicon primus]|mmetsp:Transcript_6812/g.19916  ORF Transcript_6812/g.19916 Transcript_6812/m.19916 type:complete len:228 (+) Transcript_6812:161-844(+)|eukprot:QDZ19997.1 hypothetical protein A3770_03p25150 [Chloropicon primus]